MLASSTALAKKNAEDVETEILGTIAEHLTGKKKPAVYYIGLSHKTMTKLFDKYSLLVESCDKADLIIIGGHSDKIPDTCSEVPVFVSNVDTTAIDNTDQYVGKFYWKKGRPNISIKCERLAGFNLKSIGVKYCE